MYGTNGSNGKPLLKAIIFDNNGTMLDDVHLAYGSVEAIFRLLNLPCPTRDAFRRDGSNDIAGFCQQHGAPKHVTHEELDVVRKIYYDVHVAQAHYRPDLPNALGYFKTRGLKLAVCSAENDSVLKNFLTRAKLLDCFEIVRSESRPKAGALKEIVDRLGVRPDEAAHVDDTADGIAAAQSVGIRSIGFSHPTSYGLPQSLWAQKPDHVVNDFGELRRLIVGLLA